MTKLKYTLKNDALFKMLFVKYPDLLKQLVCELIGIKLESIGDFSITNEGIPPESIGDKFCRLDINMTVDGQRVDLEIQVKDEGDYPERVLYYWAREYSSALSEGSDFINLPKTVIVSIMNFNLFECKEFHSEFQPLEVSRHTPLSDKMSFYFFELNKLPNDIKAYHNVAASSEFREIERLRSLARHNEASALRHARDEAKAEESKKWQNVVADKDAEIADKDAEITRLREQLEKKGPSSR